MDRKEIDARYWANMPPEKRAARAAKRRAWRSANVYRVRAQARAAYASMDADARQRQRLRQRAWADDLQQETARLAELEAELRTGVRRVP